MKNQYKFIQLLTILLILNFAGFLAGDYTIPGMAENDSADSELSEKKEGYIIKIESRESCLIDIGGDADALLNTHVTIYMDDEIIEHPVTGEKITVRGKRIGDGFIKEVTKDFSVIEITLINRAVVLKNGNRVVLADDVSEERGFFGKKKKKGLKVYKHKQETRITSEFFTGYFGNTSILKEEIYIGYKFPSNSIFSVEIQLSQHLYILDIYNSSVPNEYTVFAYGNSILSFNFWDKNGGLGIGGGIGFTRSGFTGNVSVLIGNMYRTGMKISFFGLSAKLFHSEEKKL
ncbi:MAG: hypothetical protein KAS39_04385 [Actinomycetia bacterium]|nr:hypothetical protein [Actinomycetes bacterium]